jgi:hypothetical protein
VSTAGGTTTPADPARQLVELYDAESQALLVFLARRTLDGHAALDLCAEKRVLELAMREALCRLRKPTPRVISAGDGGRAPNSQAIRRVDR